MFPAKIDCETRFEAARNHQICQPELLPVLYAEWGNTCARDYFGPHTEAFQQLCDLLEREGFPCPAAATYRQLAQLVAATMLPYSSCDRRLLELLAVPVLEYRVAAGEAEVIRRESDE